ncbi:hypothetical protein GCM10009557_00340 [Virgisporangium ochraceum]|uniref:Uncharacterized protein n=1 Tax=Virgisporangium ochraceum TaxID=65505 RepID=A0A8J4EGU0_9ACTN|nr:hypothetical protein [Virgisporangium ochraceum]GIJ74066.1 hypothetical protein Voc01_089830 [Virgisporangium ochraceum]
MSNRISAVVTVRVIEMVRKVRRTPDAGMETADKILWAAVVTIVVGVVGGIFRDKLRDFANGLTVTLNW